MQVQGDGYEKLNAAIGEGSTIHVVKYPTTKGELVEYYKDKYGARGPWQKNLSEGLVPFIPETGKKPAKNPAHNIARRFNPDRIDKGSGSKGQKGEYEKLGKTLTPEKFDIPKNITGKKANVHFRGEICYPSDGFGSETEDCRDRNFTVTLDAKQTNEMKHGSFKPIMDAYGNNPDAIDSIDVYSISIDF